MTFSTRGSDWTIHRDYLCNRWQCSPNESTMVLEELIARGVEDYVSHMLLYDTFQQLI